MYYSRGASIKKTRAQTDISALYARRNRDIKPDANHLEASCASWQPLKSERSGYVRRREICSFAVMDGVLKRVAMAGIGCFYFGGSVFEQTRVHEF